MNSTDSFYQTNADTLNSQYGSVPFEKAHSNWQGHWPRSGMRILDVGAGNGRDAQWMASQDCSVIALEPNTAMRQHGQRNTKQLEHGSVQWLDDRLPELSKAIALGMQFDLILVSAVWMHLADSSRERAFRKLAKLLAANGKLVITLRHGEFTDGRVAYPVSVAQIERLAKDQALRVNHKSELSQDTLGRSEVQWQTVVLSLPDDGSGDLTRVRHIIVNDSKSATYKLALLRTLLRVADAHSGAVIERHDNKVVLPLGLIALYWLKQFKRLVDDGQLQQHSNPNTSLGFVKSGWQKLQHLKADDFAIGALFFDEQALALQQALGDIISTIKAGPVAYTYDGNNKANTYFQVERHRRSRSTTTVIDQPFLASFGYFVLPESLWDCMRLYHSWIEPLVVNQWINEMRGYQRNREREQRQQINLEFYYRHLAWLDAHHNTNEVRKRVTKLEQQGQLIHSVWSGKPLTPKQRHIDHCLPFAYWPNNDFWNLLPSSDQENSTKSARVPTQYRLNASQDRILNWWQLAYSDEGLQRCFFQQAVLSLPNLAIECTEFGAVFDAMSLQIQGVKSRLMIGEW
ncbi:class I SAM-dependent methyltransferase [Ferrimonas lipolytica]|uniref:Class I SAM-dependent methyltransferase n=1 Tax=Ferrimonas lipolytica TaxID=2724191 RepID=A0A6H1UHS8_9GAMM|nr:class I SAM-dependent methyltransferase [Ferrimonas lipolytica]QIZ78594.1 class I SAM-dependent methyltransferase [Ferrimonas lipolytica]